MLSCHLFLQPLCEASLEQSFRSPTLGSALDLERLVTLHPKSCRFRFLPISSPSRPGAAPIVQSWFCYSKCLELQMERSFPSRLNGFRNGSRPAFPRDHLFRACVHHEKGEGQPELTVGSQKNNTNAHNIVFSRKCANKNKALSRPFVCVILIDERASK